MGKRFVVERVSTKPGALEKLIEMGFEEGYIQSEPKSVPTFLI
jgi:Fe2+ transport system protein FeoA